MKEDMQKKLFCKIVLITFFVAECTFKWKISKTKIVILGHLGAIERNFIE